MINELEWSLKSCAQNKPSIPVGKSREYDTLDDDLLLLLSLSSCLFMIVGLPLLGLWSVSNLGIPVEDDEELNFLE